MKIIFAIKRLSNAAGGAERIFSSIASEMAKRGCEVIILTFDEKCSTAFYPLHGKIKLINLGIGRSSKQAKLFETIHRIIVMRRAILKENPDLVIGFMHSMYVLLTLALCGTKLPIIGSEHIVPMHYRTRPIEYFLIWLCSPLLDALTVVSVEVKKLYPNRIKKRMIVIPNPVSLQLISNKNINTYKSYQILSVGRLDAQKDHETLIRAFSLIFKNFPNWSLRIVGDGPLRERLEKIVVELDLKDCVTLPGINFDINAEYESSAIFVIPSRYESFGLVTAEAMSYGLPVIGFATCTGSAQLIDHNKTGILIEFSCDPVQSLANAITKLINSLDQRVLMGEAAKNKIASLTPTGDIYNSWEDLMKLVIQKKKFKN